jgi:hypothetical protein
MNLKCDPLVTRFKFAFRFSTLNPKPSTLTYNVRRYATVTANVRGGSPEEVATKLANNGGQLVRGLQGPTISPIYTPSTDGSPSKAGSFYAVSIAVPKSRIYETVKAGRMSS